MDHKWNLTWNSSNLENFEGFNAATENKQKAMQSLNEILAGNLATEST